MTPADEDGGGDQDDLAAEWETMMADEDAGRGGDSGMETTRVLNQQEIDTLLGFDENEGGGAEESGILRC
jgi:flagellar motor switch protein FliM